MKSDQWLTPRNILDALGPFDLDPCSAPDVAVWPTANVHYTLPTDGLVMPWFGRVWLNPPYGRETARWMAKLATHDTGTALIFARTETAMFFDSVWPKATGLLFLEGRLHFHLPDGRRAKANSGGPSVLIAYGSEDFTRLVDAERSGRLKGALVQLRGPKVPTEVTTNKTRAVQNKQEIPVK